MAGSPKSLEAFDAVLNCLNAGRAAPHTSQDRYVESRWPLMDQLGRRTELVWPDYGGEQVRVIRTERRMPETWRTRVTSAAGWIVMVRIAHAQLSDDVFTRPLAEPGRERERIRDFKLSQQALLVDFLQWLMFVRRTGTLKPVANPPLMLLLSCWDELPEAQLNTDPFDVLRTRMPMVAAFAEANWQPGALRVVGLSALGRALTETNVDEEFIDRGPESFGYVVLENGKHDPDLTLAIAPMI